MVQHFMGKRITFFDLKSYLTMASTPSSWMKWEPGENKMINIRIIFVQSFIFYAVDIDGLAGGKIYKEFSVWRRWFWCHWHPVKQKMPSKILINRIKVFLKEFSKNLPKMYRLRVFHVGVIVINDNWQPVMQKFSSKTLIERRWLVSQPQRSLAKKMFIDI